MKAMKTVVLNGSPKGMTSVTMQYVRFLQKKFPQHAFTICNVCQNIKKLENDQTVWREVIEAVELHVLAPAASSLLACRDPPAGAQQTIWQSG